MKLRIDDLEQQLGRGLRPAYLLSGDEPLQLAEAGDAIRKAARAQGYGERLVLHAEAGFDWNLLTAASNSLSLFAERRLIELRLPSGKPGEAGAKALLEYLTRPPEDTVFLMMTGKLDRAAQKSKWFKAVNETGAVLQVWPVEPRQLDGWLQKRLRARGLQATPEAVALLVDRVEGNLLAAAQEVEKLVLVHGQGSLDAEQMAAAVADSARFDVFGLVDAALAGQAPRCLRMLSGLRAEGVDPVSVLWALTRDIRALADMAGSLDGSASIEAAMAKAGVWEKRKPLVRAALQRHDYRRWERLLVRAAAIDRMIKGQAPGNAWDELVQLALYTAGVRLVIGSAA